MEGGEEQRLAPPNVRDTWYQAKKLRKAMLEEITKLKNEPSEDGKLALFEGLGEPMGTFRSYCVHIIFTDLEFAAAEKVDTVLWQLHSTVSTEYRKVLNRLGRSSQLVVVKRKLEKSYLGFLRTVQNFYKTYIQRLDARYEIRELHRVVIGIKVDKMTFPDHIDQVPEEARMIILKSCYHTLIHLGDLARYKTQLRHKAPTFDEALVCYHLAHDLVPTSGYAHHQMGIAYLDEKKHLDIIYHFYRAVAIREPHPQVMHNLEAEFASLLALNTPPRHTGPVDPQEHLIFWFSKLHAHLFQGKSFSQHEELENEVLSRLLMATKQKNTAETLLKMVLVNISAYYVAGQKTGETWTMKASWCCQYTLRLNVRFMLVLGRLLKQEFEAIVARRASAVTAEQQTNGSPDKAVETGTPVIILTLPLLRIYFSWLVACREALMAAEESLEPFVRDMYRMAVKVMNLMVKLYQGENMKSSQYLLAEDEVILGLLPLDDPQMPNGCHLNWDASTKTQKPSPVHNNGPPLDAAGEIACRVLDILQCGFFLALDDKFPFMYTHVDQVLTFVYSEDGPLPATGAAQNAVAQPNQDIVVSSIDTNIPSTGPNGYAPQNTAFVNAPTGLAAPVTSQSALPPRTLDTDFGVAEDMMKLISPFIEPPEITARQEPTTVPDSTYGMHTSTANNIFGQIRDATPPTSSSSLKPFPSLPWELILQRDPRHPPTTQEIRARDAFTSPCNSPTTPIQVQGSALLDDPFVGRSVVNNNFGSAQPQAGHIQPGYPSQVEALAGGQPSAAGSYAQYLSSQGAVERHRQRLLQAFAAGPSASQPAMTTPPDQMTARHLGRKSESEISYASSQPSASDFRTMTNPQRVYESGGGHSTDRHSTSHDLSFSGFSNPDSLYQSTPRHDLRQSALTAFGRGDRYDPNDPTAYRNAIQTTNLRDAGMVASDYNAATLQSAWAIPENSATKQRHNP